MIISLKDLTLTEKVYNELLECYSVFTNIDKNKFDFINLKLLIERLPKNHNIYVYLLNDKIIACITLIIEQKIIHNGGKVGHIEDFVILEDYRKQGLGKQLLDYVKILCIQNKCYKMILDCDQCLENYYIKKGFTKKGSYMGLYF
jgi:glucosamine-phosphate N-acetyltransferase